MGIELKTKAEFGLMAAAGQVVASVLDELEAAAVPGASLRDLDQIASNAIRRHGVSSSFLNYGRPPYPNVLCASVNDVVVHGIPDETKLLEGDLVGLDFGVSLEGFHADAARTVGVGRISAERERLIDVTRRSLALAIEIFGRRDARVGDIGAAVQGMVEAAGYSVVRDFVGHGIGRRMHEEPQVPNYGKGAVGTRFRKGMAVALEPMVNEGTHEVDLMPDGWTVRTRDRRPSAHFEHTVALTDDGVVVLTQRK